MVRLSSLACTLLSYAAIFTPLTEARPQTPKTGAVFKNPKIEHFIHLDLSVGYPVNTTTIWGGASRSPNLRGNFTGSIKGTIEPVGASLEQLVTPDGSISYYTNTFTLNTTDQILLLMDVQATVRYANNALHGLSSVKFSTDGSKKNTLAHVNFDNYVGEFTANFFTGKASVDVFKLESSGRIDGKLTDGGS
ncbi:uncharacterized protein GIQ15_03581 [Arthroderma uncinatum]|uniref:uncharacterized protein n=1 Tax=Arthroderma uncinatum TaxID=74035 RepID=UPI00144AF929|nr:uncharacterized protein GIQ15_03581 [Arthroderma uncinatum]KAF3484257.1 hypothetical protein GIQ15_03581 [Arthroderma uncinatum]